MAAIAAIEAEGKQNWENVHIKSNAVNSWV